MAGDIDVLIQFIAKHFVFDEAAYPELRGATEEQRFLFALHHCALHFNKTSGNLSAVLERADHGATIELPEIKKIISKTVINALRLAELTGMDGQKIIKAIEVKYGAKITGER